MHTFLATYVHHLDPIVIPVSGDFGIRWYGLAYVAGFMAAFFLMRWFVRIGASELKESQVGDFITLCAVSERWSEAASATCCSTISTNWPRTR